MTVGLAISIALTTLWEDWIVAKLTGDARISDAVVRANLWTLLLVGLAGAIKLLRERLEHRGFLTLVQSCHVLVHLVS